MKIRGGYSWGNIGKYCNVNDIFFRGWDFQQNNPLCFSFTMLNKKTYFKFLATWPLIWKVRYLPHCLSQTVKISGPKNEWFSSISSLYKRTAFCFIWKWGTLFHVFILSFKLYMWSVHHSLSFWYSSLHYICHFAHVNLLYPTFVITEQNQAKPEQKMCWIFLIYKTSRTGPFTYKALVDFYQIFIAISKDYI